MGIINLDAHLDLRFADCASSGTPFRQLALGVTRSSAVFTIPSGLAGRRTPERYGMKRRAAVAIVEDLEVLTASKLACCRSLSAISRNSTVCI